MVVHNIQQFPITERPGKESYDPVMQSGDSVRAVPMPMRRHCLRALHAC